MSEQIGEVTGLNLFPIKSCQAATIGGEHPTSLKVGLTGFVHQGVQDRGIVIADATMLFASQRGWDKNQSVKYPADRRLATVAIDIQPDHLALTTPKFGAAEIPIPLLWGEEADVTIHGSTFGGFDLGDEAAVYFSKILDRDVRLVTTDPARPRHIKDERYHRPDASNEAAAADGFPFLIASQTSLDDAHDKSGIRRGLLRLDAYRANIELDGFSPWLEDKMRRIRIGDFSGYVLKACSRCPIPDIDQTTGERLGHSVRLLRQTRTGWRADQDPNVDPKKMYFGQNVNHLLQSIGSVVSVGANAYIDESGDPNVLLNTTV